MNVELGYLSELLKLAAPLKGVKLLVDPVAEARPPCGCLGWLGSPSGATEGRPMRSWSSYATISCRRPGARRFRWRTSSISRFCRRNAKAKLPAYCGQTSTWPRGPSSCVTPSIQGKRRATISGLRCWVMPGQSCSGSRGPRGRPYLPLQHEIDQHIIYAGLHPFRHRGSVLPRSPTRSHVAAVRAGLRYPRGGLGHPT